MFIIDHKLFYLFFLSLGIYGSSFGKYEQFVAQNIVSKELEKLLNEHSEELEAMVSSCSKKRHCTTRKGVREFSWLPGFLVKYGHERVYGAEKIKQCIEANNLTQLVVPKKYFYHLKDRPYELNSSNYLVIVEKLQRTNSLIDQKLTKEHMQQLLHLAHLTQYRDHHGDNVFVTHEGKLAIIDMGRESFWPFWGARERDVMTDHQAFRSIFYLIDRRGRFFRKDMLSQKAYEYVVGVLAEYIEKQPDKAWYYEDIADHCTYVNEQENWHWDYLAAFRKYGLIE